MDGLQGEIPSQAEIRQSRSWTGHEGGSSKYTSYVPPPHEELKQLLSQWDKYVRSETYESPLVQCALMHYQFEAICPFPSGNGRAGRLLVLLFLCENGYLTYPLLPLSRYFEIHREEYLQRLFDVSRKGDWQEWIKFFLRAIITQAKKAVADAEKITRLHAGYRNALEKTRHIPVIGHKFLSDLFLNPVVSQSKASQRYGKSYYTIANCVSRFVELGILQEPPKRKSFKLFVAPEISKLLTGKGKY